MINAIPWRYMMTTMSPASDPLKEFTEDLVLLIVSITQSGVMRSPKTFLISILSKEISVPIV